MRRHRNRYAGAGAVVPGLAFKLSDGKLLGGAEDLACLCADPLPRQGVIGRRRFPLNVRWADKRAVKMSR